MGSAGFKPLNIVLLLAIALSWAVLSEGLQNAAFFAVFLAIMALAGVSIRNTLQREEEAELLSFFAGSAILGMSAYVLSFIILRLIGVPAGLIFFLFAAASAIAFAYSAGSGKPSRMGTGFLRSGSLSVLLALYLAALFILSANSIFSPDGVFLRDTLHGTYEASMAQSARNLPGQQDLSYEGKGLSYHFGAPILALTLHDSFGVGMLVAIHRLMAMSFPLFFLILFYRLLFSFTRDGRISLLASALAFAASPLILPLDLVLSGPYGMVYKTAVMGSFGLGICITVVLLDLYLNRKGSTSLMCLMLTALTASKAPLAIPLIGAAILIGVAKSIKERKISPAIAAALFILPSALYILLFVEGAHSQNMWVLFPGFFKASSTGISGIMLYLYPFISLFISIAMVFGVTAFVLPGCFRKCISFAKSTFSHSPMPPDATIPLVITTSFLLSMFLIDITENNNYQFAIPGVLAAFALAAKSASSSGWLRQALPMGALSLAIAISIALNLSAMAVQSTGQEISANPISALSYSLQSQFSASPLNPKSAYKALSGSQSSPLPSCSQSSALPGYTRFSSGFLSALEFLEENSPQDAVFVFGYQHNMRSHPVCDWGSNTFIRTAVSGRQTVVEGQWQKGLIGQPDLESRAVADLRFYRAITEPSTYDTDAWSELNGTQPQGSKLSYDSYFRLFSKGNPLYKKDDFKRQLLSDYLSIISEDWPSRSKAAAYASGFLSQYNVTYVLFEGGERPRSDLAQQLGWKKVFEQGEAAVYAVSN